MKLKSIHIAVITIVVIFGGIYLSSVLGHWNSKEEKAPARYSDSALSGQYDPETIKGSFSFGDISDYFEIPLSDLADAFKLTDPATFSTFKCKDLETIYTFPEETGIEIGTGSVKLFVALYKGLPTDISEGDTYLLPEAVAILKSKADLSTVHLEYLASHTAILTDENVVSGEGTVSKESVTVASTTGVLSSPAVKTGEENPYAIKGTTTFKDLLDWGITEAGIESVIKMDMPFSGTKIKDFADSNSLDFGEIKIAFEEMVKRIIP